MYLHLCIKLNCPSYFSALMMLVEQQEEHMTCKNFKTSWDGSWKWVSYSPKNPWGYTARILQHEMCEEFWPVP